MFYDEDLEYMLDEEFDDDDMDYDFDDDSDEYDDDDDYMNEDYQVAMLEEAARKITMTVNKDKDLNDKYKAYAQKQIQRGKKPLSKSEWEARRAKALKAAKIAGMAAGGAALATGAAIGIQHGATVASARSKKNPGYNKGKNVLTRQHFLPFDKWGKKHAEEKYINQKSWARKIKGKFLKEDPELAMALYESGIQDPEMQLAFIEGYYSDAEY